MLFGSLTPVSVPMSALPHQDSLEVSPPPVISRIYVGEQFSASGAIVMDVLSGEELFGLSVDMPRSMGSLAKLMTAIVITENHSLGEMVTVPKGAERIEGNVARLLPGEKYTVHEMLSALLIASANDAAHTLAVHHSGDSDLFAEEMNDRARVLGLTQTHFNNPIGFDSFGQMSTPRELAWISMYALKNETIRNLVSKKSATIRDSSGEHSITLHSTNRLLSSHPSNFFGLKTGTTDGAGQCLISLAYAYGRPYLLVVLRSSDRWSDTLQLFESITQLRV